MKKKRNHHSAQMKFQVALEAVRGADEMRAYAGELFN
jgi:hypothetical protein